MGGFKLFKKSSEKSREHEKREADQKKLALRMSQITQSVCRRGLYDHANCSPYAPCFDICPVFSHSSAPNETRDLDVEPDTQVDTSLGQLSAE